MGRLANRAGATPHSVDAVTRACWARALVPAAWEELLRQAAQTAKLSSEQLESDATTSLLLLVSEAAGSPSPTTLAYLRHSINPSRSSPSPPLVRPGFLARQTCFLHDASLEMLDQVLAIVSPALLAGGEGTPSYTTTQPSEVLEGVAIASSLIIAQLTLNPSAQTPTLNYISHFLSHLPLRMHRKDLNDESIERCVAALAPTLDALAAFPDSVFLQQLHLRLSTLHSLIATTTPLRVIPPADLNECTTFPDPDMTILVHSFINSSSFFGTTPQSNTPHLAALFRYRIAESPARGGTSESALLSAFLELLLAAMEPLRSEGAHAVERSFAYSKLPELLSALFTNAPLATEAGPEGLQGCLESALRKFKILARPMSSSSETMDVDGSSTNGLLGPLLIGLYRQELISLDVAASLGDGIEDVLLEPWAPQDYTDRFLNEPDSLDGILTGMATDYASHRAIISALQACIETHAHANDLSALAPFCTTLSAYPDVLAIAFLHTEPHVLLSPVREILEGFDRDTDSFDEGHPIERYGAVTLFVELTLSRFSLLGDLPRHLGASKGFFVHWLPSASAVYGLPSLNDDAKAAVQGWVGALFGEGISDELMHSTDPRVLLRVAPTICKQSLSACQAGVIDLNTLREGLSYFLQELLSFTLPGVLRWLIAEIHRGAAGPAQETMIEILQVFVFSDSLPSAVLELVRSDLVSLVVKFSTAAPPLLDLTRLAKLIGPSPRSLPSTSPLQQLLADLTTIITSPSSTPLSPFLLTALSLLPSPTLLFSLIPHLLSLVPSPPLTKPSWLLTSRLRRTGSTLLSSRSNDRTYPLLESLVRSYLPATLRALAAIEVPEDARERARIEMLAEMVAGAVLLVRERGEGELEREMREGLGGLGVGEEGTAVEVWWKAWRGSGMVEV